MLPVHRGREVSDSLTIIFDKIDESRAASEAEKEIEETQVIDIDLEHESDEKEQTNRDPRLDQVFRNGELAVQDQDGIDKENEVNVSASYDDEDDDADIRRMETNPAVEVDQVKLGVRKGHSMPTDKAKP